MIKEKSCGAVVFYIDSEKILYLIEHMNGGHYSLPKGHVEKDETEKETALREIKEETSLDVDIDTSFRETITYSPYSGCQKDVIFFVARAKNLEFKKQDEEVKALYWLEEQEAINILSHDSDKNVLIKAINYIKKERTIL